MNAPVKDIKAAVTTGPLPASTKIFAVPEAAPDLRVPLREIQLQAGAGEPNVVVYDTSGPYTDPTVVIDVEKGLSGTRAAWVTERGGVEAYDGRAIKPEDNGNVGEKLAARCSPRESARCAASAVTGDAGPSSPAPASSPRR